MGITGIGSTSSGLAQIPQVGATSNGANQQIEKQPHHHKQSGGAGAVTETGSAPAVSTTTTASTGLNKIA